MRRIGEDEALEACPDCLGDGGGESRPYGYDPRDGTPLTNWITCATCGGEREFVVRLRPAGRDDDLEEREEELAASEESGPDLTAAPNRLQVAPRL